MAYDLRGKRVYVAGHRGMVGSAIVRRLSGEGCEILTAGRDRIDLRRQTDAEGYLAAERPHAVFVAAATVGGIYANDTRPADFIYDNLMIEANLIEAARRVGVEKLLFLGSSCIYPKLAPQPMSEDALLTGQLEPTNQWYALAKIAGVKLCAAYRRQHGCDFISAMPTNMYGPNDNYDLESSHVLPALLRKFHEAKIKGEETVVCWGSGTPRREFLHADDLGRACLFLMENYSEEEFINIGFGGDVTIDELAQLIKRIVGFKGRIVWDTSRPDGTPRKLMDSSRIFSLGWKPEIDLETGLSLVYRDFVSKTQKGVLRSL